MRIARYAFVLGVIGSLLAPAAAGAAEYPEKPIRLIIPFAPGGSTDIAGRLIGDELGKRLGVPIVVENRAGAGGTIGAAAAAAAPADGYTLLLGPNGSMTISPNLYSSTRYDPVKDFAPISLIVTAPSVLLVHNSVPAESVQDLIKLAGEQQLSFASAGMGSTQFLSGEMFKALAKVPLLHVPYKGGGAAAVDLNGGRVSMMFDTLPSALANLRLGNVHALGITSTEPVQSLPGVPPIADALPGFTVDAWYALFGPAGTPEPVVAKLNAQIHAILADPEVSKRLVDQGLLPAPSTPEELRERIRKELPEYKNILDAAGAKAE